MPRKRKHTRIIGSQLAKHGYTRQGKGQKLRTKKYRRKHK